MLRRAKREDVELQQLLPGIVVVKHRPGKRRHPAKAKVSNGHA